MTEERIKASLELSPETREIWALRYVWAYAVPEIASRLKFSETMIKNVIKLADVEINKILIKEKSQ